MRWYLFSLVTCCLCLVAFAPIPVASRLVGGIDLSALCEKAELVVVGRVDGVREDGFATVIVSGMSYPAKRMVAQLAIEKVLKGQPSGGVLNLSFGLPTVRVMDMSPPPAVAGQYQVFFLRRQGEGYQVVDPDYPSVVANPGSPPTYGSVLDQVIAEVCYVLASPRATPDDKQKALGVLRGVPSPIVMTALKTATRDPVPDVRLSAMALLLHRNDISELVTAENILLHPPSDIDQNALDGLAFAIRFGVHDPKAIPSLTRLMAAKNVNVRIGAATALRRTHDGAAIKPLTQGLYDSDPDVLYQAVIGLAELTYTRGEWAPGEGLFLKDQKRYLDYWREWARSQKQMPE
jgi:hypothetical protein